MIGKLSCADCGASMTVCDEQSVCISCGSANLQQGHRAGRLTYAERAESLLLFRRRLTEKIILALIASVKDGLLDNYYVQGGAATYAEDLSNAICERLAARETGSPTGYK